MLVEWICRGKPTVIGICSGAVAGLVAITPASGFVGPAGSMAIGVAAGVLCYWGVTGLKRILGADDALDCFGVHGVGGIVGALLTGVFAITEYGGTAGLIEGNAAQMINQVQGVAVVIIYDAVVSLILLKVIDAVIGLRVSEEVEREGLDLALHGEVVQVDLAVGAEPGTVPSVEAPVRKDRGLPFGLFFPLPGQKWPKFPMVNRVLTSPSLLCGSPRTAGRGPAL